MRPKVAHPLLLLAAVVPATGQAVCRFTHPRPEDSRCPEGPWHVVQLETLTELKGALLLDKPLLPSVSLLNLGPVQEFPASSFLFNRMSLSTDEWANTAEGEWLATMNPTAQSPLTGMLRLGFDGHCFLASATVYRPLVGQLSVRLNFDGCDTAAGTHGAALVAPVQLVDGQGGGLVRWMCALMGDGACGSIAANGAGTTLDLLGELGQAGHLAVSRRLALTGAACNTSFVWIELAGQGGGALSLNKAEWDLVQSHLPLAVGRSPTAEVLVTTDTACVDIGGVSGMCSPRATRRAGAGTGREWWKMLLAAVLASGIAIGVTLLAMLCRSLGLGEPGPFYSKLLDAPAAATNWATLAAPAGQSVRCPAVGARCLDGGPYWCVPCTSAPPGSKGSAKPQESMGQLSTDEQLQVQAPGEGVVIAEAQLQAKVTAAAPFQEEPVYDIVPPIPSLKPTCCAGNAEKELPCEEAGAAAAAPEGWRSSPRSSLNRLYEPEPEGRGDAEPEAVGLRGCCRTGTSSTAEDKVASSGLGRGGDRAALQQCPSAGGSDDALQGDRSATPVRQPSSELGLDQGPTPAGTPEDPEAELLESVGILLQEKAQELNDLAGELARRFDILVEGDFRVWLGMQGYQVIPFGDSKYLVMLPAGGQLRERRR